MLESASRNSAQTFLILMRICCSCLPGYATWQHHTRTGADCGEAGLPRALSTSPLAKIGSSSLQTTSRIGVMLQQAAHLALSLLRFAFLLWPLGKQTLHPTVHSFCIRGCVEIPVISSILEDGTEVRLLDCSLLYEEEDCLASSPFSC